MTRVLLLIPQSSSKFELLPPTSKWALLVAIFIPKISYCHSSVCNHVLFCHRIFHHCCHKTQGISLQVAPSLFLFYGELLLFTHSNPWAHDILLYTPSHSKNVPLLIILNLVLSHDMCKEESSHPRSPCASKCLHEAMPPYFLHIYYLYDPI